MIRIFRRVTRRGPDDGYALLFTVFLMLVISVLTAAALGVYASEAMPTRLAKKTVETVDAASAGLQAALGQLRNTTTNGYGDLTKLPCSDPSDQGGVSIEVDKNDDSVSVPGDQISGVADSTTAPGATGTYRAVIVYFLTDPSSHFNDSDTSWWSANAIPCKAGVVKTVPNYAFLQSFGTDSQITGEGAKEGNRTIHGVYQFNAVALNQAGGRMIQYGSTSSSNPDGMCWDIDGPGQTGNTPSNGWKVFMEPCLAAGTLHQDWLYRSDLTIQYGGNTALAGGKGFCITNWNTSSNTYMSPATSAGTPVLEPCVTNGASGSTYNTSSNSYPGGTAQEDQEWAYDDNGHFQAPSSTGTVGDGYCLSGNGGTKNVATNDTQLTMSSGACSAGSSQDASSWAPDAKVGAGAAGGNTTGVPGTPTNQFVNYALFGRCLDVNGQSFGNNSLIAYPCKQAPNANTLTWNQIWHYQPVSGGYGIFYTACTGGGGCTGGANGNDCLYGSSTEDSLVLGTTCPTGTVPDQDLWHMTGQLSGNYAGSYLMVNKASGLCMAFDPNKPAFNGWPQAVSTDCGGQKVPSGSGVTPNSLLLKWNAPPNAPATGLADQGEDLNGQVH